MPGGGRCDQRGLTTAELDAIARGAEVLGAEASHLLEQLGESTYDISLNDDAIWRNVPELVWEYTMGGYPVLKKWLSYRDRSVIGRALDVEEVREFTRIARRIAAILLLQPQLDALYNAAKEETFKVDEG